MTNGKENGSLLGASAAIHHPAQSLRRMGMVDLAAPVLVAMEDLDTRLWKREEA